MDKKVFQTELEELCKLKSRVEDSLKYAPKGILHSEMAQGKYPQYYVVEENDINQKGSSRSRKYIRKNELEQAKKLAQKEYDRLVLENIKKRERAIREILKTEYYADIHTLYKKMSPAKQFLVTPYVWDNESYIKQWKEITKSEKNSFPFSNSFQTDNGELVRSKSEKIIADKLNQKRIPYKYEMGLKLGDNVVYPDFTILKMSTREEVYLEHFGMMDNPDYCKKALEKIELYECNGIRLGERLFVSLESSLKSLSSRYIEILLDNFY